MLNYHNPKRDFFSALLWKGRRRDSKKIIIKRIQYESTQLYQARVSSALLSRRHSRSGKCPSQKMDYPLQAALRAASEDRLQQVGEELHPHPGIVYFRLFGGTIRERNAGNRENP